MNTQTSDNATLAISSSENYPNSPLDENSSTPPLGNTPRRAGRRKINIEFIDDKSRRHITFSKRKAGIMKKAYELSTLTGTQVLLLVASETGHVYTFATPKLQPLITKPDGKNLIQACLNAPDTLQGMSNGQSNTTAFSQQPDHNPSMNQSSEYLNQHSPSPYHPAQEDIKPTNLPFMPRSSFNDVKPFQPNSPNPHEHNIPSSPYSPYPSNQMINSGIRMPAPYSPHASLPTLTDRGSFSNLPSSQINYNQGMPSYQLPNASSQHFPSQSFPNSPQLFSKASNLPDRKSVV